MVALVLAAASILKLDAGTAAGVLAGGAMESAVIGTASEAIGRLGSAAEARDRARAKCRRWSGARFA